jgi:hypothetical protein
MNLKIEDVSHEKLIQIIQESDILDEIIVDIEKIEKKETNEPVEVNLS